MSNLDLRRQVERLKRRVKLLEDLLEATEPFVFPPGCNASYTRKTAWVQRWRCLGELDFHQGRAFDVWDKGEPRSDEEVPYVRREYVGDSKR